MAATNRLFVDFLSGTTDADPGSGGTTLSGDFLADLPAVSDPDFIALTLDPEAADGDPEVVWVTAHTASATTATVQRGKEGSTARAHDSGTKVVAALTADAVEELETLVEDHASRHLLGGADALDWPGSFEVDAYNEVAFVDLGTSFTDSVGASVTIPAAWGSWTGLVIVTMGYIASGKALGDLTLDIRTEIDGETSQVQTLDTEDWLRSASVVGRATGRTSTGSVSLHLQARESGSNIQLRDINLYARAVRTS